MHSFGPYVSVAGHRYIRDPSRLLLTLNSSNQSDPSIESQGTFLDRYGLMPEGSEQSLNPHEITRSEQQLFVFAMDKIPDDTRLGIETEPEVVVASSVFRHPDFAPEDRRGLAAILSTSVCIVPEPGVTEADRNRIADDMRELGFKERRYFGRRQRTFQVFEAIDPLATRAEHILTLAAQLPHVQSAEPDLYPMLEPTAHVPSDRHFTKQWSMCAIGAGGAGVTAWDYAHGADHVTVAVIDSGVLLDHEDLCCAPGVGAPAGTNLDGGPTDFGHGRVDCHGTRCAGIIGALHNSSGVAGLAGGCRILSINYRPPTSSNIAWAIEQAVARDAQIISMSFTSPHYRASCVAAAVAHARARGVLMCASAGNEAHIVGYPARFAEVMAVGATDRLDDPAADVQTTPCAGFGHPMQTGYLAQDYAVSVAAPGVDIATTDVDGGYFVDPGFTGTSAATPHVAGLAALLMSGFAPLHGDGDEVRRIIERTCDKVSHVEYSLRPNFPNGPISRELGYGRINALRAMQLANDELPSASGGGHSSPNGQIASMDDDSRTPLNPSDEIGT